MKEIPDYVREYYDARIAEFFGVGAGGSRVFTPPPKKAIVVEHKRTRAPAKREAAKRDRPRGRLGAIFAHGSACLAWEVEYMRHGRRLIPSGTADWHSSKNQAEWHGSQDMSVNFCEWQHPGFDAQSPDFTRFNTGVRASDFVTGINKSVYGQKPGGWNKPDTVDWLNTYLAHDVRGPQGGAGTSAHSTDPIMSPDDRPAQYVQQWLMWIVGEPRHGKDRQFEKGISLVAPYALDVVKPAKYWNSSSSARKEWGRRLLRWYWTAQFAVWSVEMLRIHNPILHWAQGKWWVEHCAAWGIGVRKSPPANLACYAPSVTPMAVAAKTSANGVKIGKGLVSNLSPDAWESLARWVMSLSKVPGAPGTLGDQIAQPREPRHIFDIPEELGSAVPPLYVAKGQWNQCAAGMWLAGTKTSNYWTDRFLPAWNAIFGALASASGSAAFNGFVSLATSIYQAGCSVMRSGLALANGELSEAGDVIAGIGQIIGEIGAAAGTDLNVPDDLWAQLSSVNLPIHGFAGDLAPVLESKARILQATLGAVRAEGYDHLDELLGGLTKDD